VKCRCRLDWPAKNCATHWVLSTEGWSRMRWISRLSHSSAGDLPKKATSSSRHGTLSLLRCAQHQSSKVLDRTRSPGVRLAPDSAARRTPLAATPVGGTVLGGCRSQPEYAFPAVACACSPVVLDGRSKLWPAQTAYFRARMRADVSLATTQGRLDGRP
jgi:hypothetical protein